MRGLALLAVVGLSLGQKQARIGPDGKPLLNRPDLAECMKSESDEPVRRAGHIKLLFQESHT